MQQFSNETDWIWALTLSLAPSSLSTNIQTYKIEAKKWGNQLQYGDINKQSAKLLKKTLPTNS